MYTISDRVKESTNTQGTGDILLLGPHGSFQSFADGIGDGNTTLYTIENGIYWEVGAGTYSSSTNTLSRDLVFDSSNNGSKVLLSGTSTVFCTSPADKSVIKDSNDDITISGVFANSGVISAMSGVTFNGPIFFTGDILTSGDVKLDDGFLTLIRPNSSGNFFHAYKDDGTNKTISLFVSHEIDDPLWKLGLKQNPDNRAQEPQYSYVYGREATAGILNDSGNYFQIGAGFGFAVTSNYHNTFIASADDGVSVNTNNVTNPAFTIEKAIGSPQDLQQWQDAGGSPLSVVDNKGRLGLLKTNPSYPLDVSASGRIGNIILTNSGVYFSDGTFQPSAASDDTAISISGYFQTYVDNQENAESGWAGATIANTGAAVSGWTRGITFFTEDLTVSLPNGKTFGRYETGETIPASGKTPREVIEMAIVEPIAPTVSLTSSSSVDFNQTSVSNTLNFSHTINSFGASVATASLEFRRANTGSWTVLNSSTSASSSFVHSFTDTAYNTDVMNYRYVVTDTAGGTATATKDIQPDTYSNPTISLTVTGASISSPETWNSREKGNVSSTISCTINRNESYVDLQTYEIEYSLNGGAYQVVDSGSIGPGNTTITPFAHNPVADNAANNMRYRVKVVDEYLDSIGSQRYSSVRQVNYNYILYFGSESSAATTSNEVRGLSNKRFPSAGDTFDFNTGNTLRFFNVAIPDGETISSVIDLDALNANITSSYINNPFNVQDFGGNNKLYNVYTMEVAVPYSSSHTHRITKG